MSEILKPEEDLIMDKDDVVEREEELDEDNEDLEREEAGKVISINQKNNNHVTKTVKIVNYDVEEEEAVVEHGKGCSHHTVCLCIQLLGVLMSLWLVAMSLGKRVRSSRTVTRSMQLPMVSDTLTDLTNISTPYIQTAGLMTLPYVHRFLPVIEAGLETIKLKTGQVIESKVNGKPCIQIIFQLTT